MKTRYHKSFHQKHLAMIVAAGTLLGIAVARMAADEAATNPDPPKTNRWESVATVGATLTRGNSKSFLASASINTKHKWTRDEALLGASVGYGQNTTTVNGNKTDTTTESDVRGYGQWNHELGPQTYTGARVTGDHDDLAALAYRLTVSPLVGYYFIKQTNTFLAGEVGPSYVREKFFGENVHNYIGLRIGERFEHKFATGAKVWQSLEWIPKVTDLQNYLLTVEAGISAPLSRAFSLSLVADDIYKSVPAIGKLKNDLRIIAGVSYSF